jgi:hypothetical protein
MLALAVERAPNRWVAGGLTLVFGVWVLFVVLSVWSDQPAIPAIAVVLAGNWIDTLAREPAARRPAFARATPALAITLLGLVVLMPSGSHRAMTDWHLSAGSIWPGIALLVGLAIATGWNAWRTGVWRSRAVALTALAAVWLIVWFTLPGPLRTSQWLQWIWTTAFSTATVLMGASAVREAARTRDLGQFVLGILSVVAFVFVRVIDARSLVVSGLMLLASAFVLWWLGRQWARAAATGVAS